ncbi:C3 and PZP-like alpha-2-macroglobulin domain-containing protein 8 [Spodoptera frugiperda]|uniref:C3 and PZP-like alpha-2-macroglobulin domain-containing protein 8 n=1 Tax=Spodoptera frugiperda TaxID=7108 RepID=A0A9R0F4U0_SPOFR|nr:C3 and PZP-like alpha-2-macroglobulin domain-containing protein 8 [Spodoptera frugiperda]
MAVGVLLLALQLAVVSAGKCTTGFSVVAPEVAVPGKTTAILVTLHGRAGDETLDPLNVTVRLETQDANNEVKQLIAASQMIMGYGIIPLKIPSSPATHCTLHTTVGCVGNDECTAKSHSVIRLLGPVRDVIVRPARHHYRPGETITFWILALDHDLRLVRGELAYVALSDPAGTKVAIWEQLSMDEGVRKLSAILATGARSGTWRIEARCGGGSARVDITVGNGVGNAAAAAPAAEQHYVELRFADSMRRRYKPGLPFVGRVEAMSTEKRVRVRVKLYDDKTDIYSQDIDMSTGEGGFIVPTVMADAPYVNLQAELVAVEGKEIETHYVLARERIRRWNSTSKCYLLVENLPTPLQAGGIASASVWSSCGCRQRLLAAVTSGGRAVHWAAVPAPPANDSDLCRFNYTFPVTADMAPVSSLLVYYVTEAGEPVSDVASFHVRLLHKEVAVAIEERRWWYPRAALQLRVLAPPDSTMCLIGARAPPDARFDPHQTTPEHEEAPGPEFVSAGVSLFVGGGACGGGVLYRQRTAPAPHAPAHLVPPASHDRLWMWKCFNYTNQLSTDGVTISAPSEAGRWSLWALSLSNHGLRFSAPRTINVFRPIQLDFSLPPALKVGETVEVDVKITNNINNCMDVTALLALSAGAAFASTGALYVTERLRLGPRGGTQLVVRVAVNTPGRKNITVEVTGYSADNCSVSYTSFNNETLVGSVIRSASVLVLPEGLHRTDTQSAYFCANEHLAVSSRGSWEWQWVAAPRNRAGLVLELRAQGAAHVALSSIREPSDDMYRVVFERTRVWIAKGKHGYDVHLASAEQTESDEDCSGADSWCAWWVWWEGGRLSVGRGAAPSERRLLVWPLAPDMRIKFVGFSALWGDKADFRIWNFNEEAGFSQVLELGLPRGVVPGSASGTLLVSGGLHLPLYSLQTDSTDQWAEVWRDSQLSAASASLAPLLALEHIPHLVDDAERERILRKLPEQVQVLLSFRKSDNSFSDHPGMSSHLSTIKILEILTKIQSYYPIDPELLQNIKKWIQKRQNADGSFTPLAADKEVDYYPVDITKSNGTAKEVDVNEYYYYDKDGNMTQEEIDWERRVEVTAETLVALLEVGVENQVDADVAKKSQNYLEHNLHNLTSPAALAATVLALVLARSPIVPEALVILRNASTTEEGEFGWPAPRKDAADWLLEETSRNIKTTSYEAVTMEQYVAGVRVLLAACARGALAEGEAAARFLYYRASTLQRHPSLAYSATKAAAQYAALAHDRHRALTVSLATAGMELTDTLELRARTPPRPLQLPGLPTKVFVYATGAGCATVQGTITYSTYTPKPENALLNIQAAIIEEIRPERSSIEDLQGNLPTLIIKTCFKWKGKERSGILRLESSLFSGYELHSVNPVVLDGATFADLHYGSRGESVWFVFANISSTCPVCVTYEVRSKFVITSLRPAFAKIYPSTRPDLAVETFFHARPGSPLLRGITDDDFITWFDKTELASLKTSTSIDNICECGRICSRDYEFRKNYEEHTEGTTENVDTTTEQSSTITTTEPSTTEEITSTESSTSASTTEIVTTQDPTTTTDKTTTDNLSTIKIESIDDPIIIPTVTYVNTTEKQDVNNDLASLLPKITGELIVPKSVLPRKEDFKKKPLPRRKGTLKATYGDKHEKFFLKLREMENSVSTTTTSTTITTPTVTSPSTTTMTTAITSTEVPQEITNNEKETTAVPIAIETEKSLHKIVLKKPDHPKPLIPVNVVANKTELKTKLFKINAEENMTKVNKTVTVEIPTTELPITHNDITTVKPIKSVIPHTITAITNNNIKSIHYRTKKPKPITQIKKPVINNVHNITKPNKSEDIDSDIINKTKKKTIVPQKYNAKTMKSINKEIHKIPPTPISETSKTLSETLKYDIAPENKGGFEILDKNNLWELLKEGSDNDPSKLEEKLHVHNRLNILGHNASNIDDNRSL